jgi:hypothetical protein
MLPVLFEPTNSSSKESMHFVETTKNAANQKKYFRSIGEKLFVYIPMINNDFTVA